MRRRLVGCLGALVGLCASGLAYAQAGTSVTATVELGATQTVSVGYAKGFLCDDLAVADVQLLDGSDANLLQVTGQKLGGTLCRVGMDPVGPKFYVHIVVVPKKSASGQVSPPPPSTGTSEPVAKDAPEVGTPAPREDEAPAPADVPDKPQKKAKGRTPSDE